MVPEVFAMSFRDHNPLRLPGFLEPYRKNWGTAGDVYNLLIFLRSPLVDLGFSLEDVFSSGDRVCYRLFCEGTVRTVHERDPNPMGDQAMQSMKVDADNHYEDPSSDGVTRLLLERVGIFRVFERHLIEHWGSFTTLG